MGMERQKASFAKDLAGEAMAAAHWWSRWLVAQAGVDPVTGEAGTTLQSTGEPEVGAVCCQELDA